MIGLYYPYIHIRDEAWLKMALLYWDQIARIVPDDYVTSDSESVIIARGEDNAVIDASPTRASSVVAGDFARFIRDNEDQLTKKYGIQNTEQWPDVPHTAKYAPSGTNPKLANIFESKINQQLLDALYNANLATVNEIGRGGRWSMWVGVHPDIASVYMTSLAESISEETKYNLLASSVGHHAIVGSVNTKRLAELLLSEPQDSSSYVVDPHLVASIAIKTVVPKSLSTVPIQKIIEFRKTYAGEITQYRSWINSLADALSAELDGIQSPRALKNHLENVARTEIEPNVVRLEKAMNRMGFETVSKVISVKPTKIFDGALGSIAAVPSAVASLSIAAIPAVAEGQRAAEALVAENPSAYLMFAREQLSPRSTINRIRASTRRFVLGV